MPPGTESLWQAFNELSGARVPGGMGIGPITLSEIAAWQGVFGVRLTPWEVETILAIDRAVLSVVSG